MQCVYRTGNHGEYPRTEQSVVQDRAPPAQGKTGITFQPRVAQCREDERQQRATAAERYQRTRDGRIGEELE